MLRKQVRTIAENETIFREGEAGDCAYLIETGRVLVYLMKNGVEVPLKILGTGDIFGEMSMIDCSLRSASCRTLSDVRLVTVTQEQLVDRIQSADPIVRLLMRAMMDRLRVQNDAIRGISISPTSVKSEKDEREKQEALDCIGLENRIAIGIESNEFVPHYQPIYDLESQQIIGCEGLIRWTTADGKTISPAAFIDVLEESTLILEVGKMMMEKCMADLVRLQATLPLPRDFFVSVNVSGKQFADPNFVAMLEKARSQAGVAARHIKLEVTERIMTDGPQAISTLQSCRALGYKIAIDDFGTGFSSLQYLASMPLNDLKVDRIFVLQMMTHAKPLSIVKTLIYLARLLNLNLIAEGIETQAQLELLRHLGVQMGQGFLFSKAVPYEAFVALITASAMPDKQAA